MSNEVRNARSLYSDLMDLFKNHGYTVPYADTDTILAINYATGNQVAIVLTGTTKVR